MTTLQYAMCNEETSRTFYNPLEPEVLAILELSFNGIQSMPGCPDRLVFTDNLTRGTFFAAMDVSISALQEAAERVRLSFAIGRAITD